MRQCGTVCLSSIAGRGSAVAQRNGRRPSHFFLFLCRGTLLSSLFFFFFFSILGRRCVELCGAIDAGGCDRSELN